MGLNYSDNIYLSLKTKTSKTNLDFAANIHVTYSGFKDQIISTKRMYSS